MLDRILVSAVRQKRQFFENHLSVSKDREGVYKIKRILVVEDEPIICEVCRRVLNNEGFEIDIATDGKRAQDMLEGKDYELCLIDIRTPIMDGKQLYQVIVKKHQKLAEGVIFTTGDTTDDYIRYFLEVASKPFLYKPFTPDELKAVVRQTVRQIERRL